jgi:hypothetical protein
MQKDVKFNGTNQRSPLESTKVSKKRTQTNSKRTGKTCCKHAKKPKRSGKATSKRQVQEEGNYPLQGGIIALAPSRDGNDRRFVRDGIPNDVTAPGGPIFDTLPAVWDNFASNVERLSGAERDYA